MLYKTRRTRLRGDWMHRKMKWRRGAALLATAMVLLGFSPAADGHAAQDGQRIESERYGFSLLWPDGWHNYFQDESVFVLQGIPLDSIGPNPNPDQTQMTWEELGVCAAAQHEDGSLLIFRQVRLEPDTGTSEPYAQMPGDLLRWQALDWSVTENGIPFAYTTPQGYDFTIQRLRTAEENVFPQMFIASAILTDREILVLYLPAKQADIPMLQTLLASMQTQPCAFSFPSVYASIRVTRSITGRQWYTMLGLESNSRPKASKNTAVVLLPFLAIFACTGIIQVVVWRRRRDRRMAKDRRPSPPDAQNGEGRTRM